MINMTVGQLIEHLKKLDPEAKVETGYGVLRITGAPKGDTIPINTISLDQDEWDF